VLIWYIFSGFGIMHQEKSGNPPSDANRDRCYDFNLSFRQKVWRKNKAVFLLNQTTAIFLKTFTRSIGF
jgi:hypothetical protein